MHWQESTGPRPPLFKEEPTSPPRLSHTATSLPAKRRAVVKTEPTDRYGGLVGEQVHEKDSKGTADMDTGIDGRDKRVVASD